MKINQTILYLVLGLLLLPVIGLILYLQGGLILTILALFLVMVSVSFLFISLKRIFHIDLLKNKLFLIPFILAVIILILVVLHYMTEINLFALF